jgi:hypothetical protein
VRKRFPIILHKLGKYFNSETSIIVSNVDIKTIAVKPKMSAARCNIIKGSVALSQRAVIVAETPGRAAAWQSTLADIGLRKKLSF